MQSLLESLPNYIHYGTTMKPYRRGSWNYVHQIWHHHEISPRGSWNYVYHIQHHHEISPRVSWNYINLIP